MRVNGYSFPHPVLGLGNDIDGTCEADYKLNFGKTEDYEIKINYKLDNADLAELISEKKAVFVSEITCSSTLYRQCFKSDDMTHIVLIPKTALRNRVDIKFFLCASNKISNYRNSKAHTDYGDYKFNIGKGDLLAYIGEFSFMAFTNYEELKAVSSFLEITEGKFEEGNFLIYLDYDKIKIELSKKDYKCYSNPTIGRQIKYAAVFHSSIVFPALIHVLYTMISGNGDNEFDNKPWYQALDIRLKEDEELSSIPRDEENIPRIAQILLGTPLERLLDSLDKMEQLEGS